MNIVPIDPLRMATRTACCVLALGLPLAPVMAQSASASSSAPSARPDPLDAREEVPALEYRSAFAGYRRHADAPVGSWRELNETVNRIGGWRAYAREAAGGVTEGPAPGGSDAGARPPTAPTPPTRPDSRDGR